MPKVKNPIALKLLKLIQQSADPLIREKICVSAKIKYPTFENMFFRKTISGPMINLLLAANIITERDCKNYYEWVRDNVPPPKKRASKKKPVGNPKKKVNKNKLLLDDEEEDLNDQEITGGSEAEHSKQDQQY